MKVNSYICNKKFPYDAEEFTFKDIISHLEQCKSNIETWMIGNIELANTQIDILIIKKNCLISLDMKNYSGKIIGDENGDWHVETKDGKTIEINDNCFQQAHTQRFALVDKLKDVVKNGGLAKFKDNPGVFTYSKAWMYFNEGSTYDYPLSLQKALNWFKVITDMDTLCRAVINADSSDNYRFTEADINEFITVFHAEKIDIEKENVKRKEETGSSAEKAYPKAILRLKHPRELDKLITNLNFIETPESKGIKGRKWEELKETVHRDTYYFEDLKEGEILPIHGDMGIGKTTYMLFFVENILKGGNNEVIFLDSTRLESSLAEIEHERGKFVAVDALGNGGSVKEKSEQLIDFVKSNRAKLILTMRTHEKDIFVDVVREKGYEIKNPVVPKPPLDAVPYIVANYLRHFDVNTEDLAAYEAYEIIYDDEYVYVPKLKEALELITEKSNGCPFYIYHAIRELSRKGLPFDLATVKELPAGVEELLINTLRTEFVFKGEGEDGNKSFLKLLICLSTLEKDFSLYLYEALYEELKDDFNIRDRVEAFKSFLNEGESVYEFILPSYWGDAIHKALKRDTKDKWLADEFIRAEAELDPNIIETVLKREIEKGGINRRYFHLIADVAKSGLLDYAYEKYKGIEKNEDEEKSYAEFVIYREYFLRGTTFHHSNQFERAIKDFDKIIDHNPQDVDALNSRGVVFASLEQYDAAIRDFTKAIELNPVYTATYNNRGNAYFNSEQYEDAIRDFTKVIELNPEDAHNYNIRGASYLLIEQYEDAIRDFTKAIELNPEDTIAYNNRGCAYSNVKQYEAAIRDFTRAIELIDLNPEYFSIYTGAYNNRGRGYFNLEQYDKAIRDFTKAIELNPENDLAYNNRGCAYLNVEQYEDAILDFTEAIVLNPEDAIAYRGRSIAYSKLGQQEETRQDIDNAIVLNPDDAEREKGIPALTTFVDYIIECTHEIVAEWTHNSLENIDSLFLMRAHEQGFQAGSRFWEILQNYSLFSIEELGQILEDYGDLTPKYDRSLFGSRNATFYVELSEGQAGECGVRFYNALLECDRRHEHLGGFKQWKLYLALLRNTAMLRVKYDSSFLKFLESKISKSLGVPLESVDEEYLGRMRKEEWLRFLESCPWNDIYEVGENIFNYIISDLEELHPDTHELFIKIDSTNKRFIFRTKAYKLLDPHIEFQGPDEIEDQMAIKVLKIIKGEHSLREVNTAIYAYCSGAIGKLGFCNNPDKCNECEYQGVCPMDGFRIGSERSAVNVIYEESRGYNEHDENRENPTKKEFESYTETFNTNFEGNYIDAVNSCLEGDLKHIFLKIATEMDFNSYGLKNVESNKILKHRRWGSWGRCGIECSFTPKNDYHQWFFYGIYFDSNDHKIPFKKDRVPELAFFFDIGYDLIKKSDLEKIRANLKNKANLLEALKRLSQKGFEDNLTSNLTPSKWRLLCKRIPLTEIEDFSYERIREMFEEILEQLTNETDFKEELL